uniref:Apple domain-containing protein n=1 Tax=Steinernema glaseri TaxID=37863 RepID=A0A1I7ZLK9_9BILA
MRSICLIAFFLFASCSAFENQELKPCFERYEHQKLISAEPFHSEWRMKSEEDCLPFCALSSSRCKSIVYDVLNHICHYFSEDELENMVIARRMTLFRVANRQCLLDVTKSSEVQEGEEYDDEVAQQPMSIQSPPIEKEVAPVETTTKQPATTESTTNAPEETTSSEKETTSAFSAPTELPLDDNYDVIDDLKAVTSSKVTLKEVPSDDSDLILSTESEPTTSPVPTPRQSKLITLLQPKGTEQKQEEVEAYTPYPEDKLQPKLVPLQASKVAPRPNLKLVSLERSSSTEENAPAFLPPMTVFKADRINKEKKQKPEIRRNPTSFSKAVVLKKSESTENGAEDEYKKVIAPKRVPIARSSYSVETDEEHIAKNTDNKVPVAKSYSAESVPAYIPKARGFLKSINGHKNPDVIDLEAKVERPAKQVLNAESSGESKKMFAINISQHSGAEEKSPESVPEAPGGNPTLYDQCDDSDNQIWIGVENSAIDSKISKNSVSANDVEACKKFCNSANNQKQMCSSFTFYETEKLCVMHSAAEGFKLKPAADEKFTTRSYKKFCFPEKLSAFKECSDFISFRDYSLEIEAKEQFDGMPKGVEGLQACIELCVHSPDFRCKSAAFNMDNGQCFVYDENSFTKPAAWREHLTNDLLYFENGCDMWFTEKLPAEASIKRVSGTAKAVVKKGQQKKPSYMLFSNGQMKHLQFNPLTRPVA